MGREHVMTLPPTAPLSTTERVSRVLLAFNGASQPLGVSEIARSSSLSKAVVHRILQTLVQTHLIDYVEGDRKYRLGPASFALGRQALRQSDLHAAALPVISHLSALTGETTTLVQRSGHSRHYIDQMPGSDRIRISIRIGESVPLWSGASGLSILAFMDDSDVDYVLSGERTAYNERTVTDADAIRRRLDEIRQRGWAHTAGERVRYSSSIAAPIFAVDGKPAGSLSVAFLADRMSDDRQELADLVVASARDASNRLAKIERGQ